jgi:hypothetical protein
MPHLSAELQHTCKAAVLFCSPSRSRSDVVCSFRAVQSWTRRVNEHGESASFNTFCRKSHRRACSAAAKCSHAVSPGLRATVRGLHAVSISIRSVPVLVQYPDVGQRNDNRSPHPGAVHGGFRALAVTLTRSAGDADLDAVCARAVRVVPACGSRLASASISSPVTPFSSSSSFSCRLLSVWLAGS